MKLLVSPYTVEEAGDVLKGRADIIDVKNPKEGSLGANFPWVIRDIISIAEGKAETSATMGDLKFKPGQASQAAFGLSLLGLDYIKAGLAFTGMERAEEMARSIVRAVEERTKVIIAGYADYALIKTLSPLELPAIAEKAGAHGVMIDTFTKKGRGLFDFMSEEELSVFIEEAHSKNLEVALAGSLKEEQILRVKKLGADIAGVRGAVCAGGDRVNGKLSIERVKELKKICSVKSL